jgi:hypothetical protein
MHSISVVALTMIVANLSVFGAGGREIAQSPATDACGLFTLEEAGKALGRTFRRARPDQQPGGTTCSLSGGTEGSIVLALSPAASKKNFDDFRKLLAEQGEKVEPVKGVGDEAFYWGDRIQVLTGTKMLVIYNGDSTQPSAKVRADILTLAKLAVPKLK